MGLDTGGRRRAILRAENAGDSVVVVYNNNVSESRILAEYYASRRQVPKEQSSVWICPNETMTRANFGELQKPLLEKLEKAKLFSFRQEIQPATKEKPGSGATSDGNEGSLRRALLWGAVKNPERSKREGGRHGENPGGIAAQRGRRR